MHRKPPKQLLDQHSDGLIIFCPMVAGRNGGKLRGRIVADTVPEVHNVGQGLDVVQRERCVLCVGANEPAQPLRVHRALAAVGAGKGVAGGNVQADGQAEAQSTTVMSRSCTMAWPM